MKKVFWLLAAGVGIGLLLAPRKGSETWQRIVDAFDDFKNNAEDSMNDLKARGKAVANKGKEEVSKVTNEWKQPEFE